MTGARLVLSGLLAIACFVASEKSSATAAELAPPRGEGLQVLITTSELVAGQNRFGFGLMKAGKLLDDATVSVRVFDIQREEPQLRTETRAVYHKLEVVEQGNHVHVHPDGTRHVHGGVTDVQGVYVARVRFERAGAWGIEVLAQRRDGPIEAARLRVEALEASHTPMPGTPAPRSCNLVAADVGDLRTIDSSEPPDPRLHQVRIADAIAQGTPLVIVFATPKFCVSRVCGPVVDVVRTLIPTYRDRVAFVHQEIWHSNALDKFSLTAQEWRLRSEPWIFVVDGHGMVRAKFEGLTTRREVEAALRETLGLK